MTLDLSYDWEEEEQKRRANIRNGRKNKQTNKVSNPTYTLVDSCNILVKPYFMVNPLNILVNPSNIPVNSFSIPANPF